MKKAVYSLVLSEEVVEAADRMAYARGQSRSALIDEILADALGLVTPKQRVAQVFDALCADMSDSFQFHAEAAGDMLTVQSRLRFRYNPTVRYRVELRSEEPRGVLRVSFRTQSRQLLESAEAFFECFRALEIAHGVCEEGESSSENGVFTRFFPILLDSSDDLGRELGGYITRVDTALKSYFAALPDKSAAEARVRVFFGEEEEV